MLADIYQSSVDSGQVPCKWKHPRVCGLHKKGDKSDPANYRPISLTCIASKVLEHIVHSHVMKHLEQYEILTDVQHGFRAKRSRTTQLILSIHDMAKTIQDDKSIHAVIPDFTKAFDKVPHARLIKKLEYYRIYADFYLPGLSHSSKTTPSQSYVTVNSPSIWSPSRNGFRTSSLPALY